MLAFLSFSTFRQYKDFLSAIAKKGQPTKEKPCSRKALPHLIQQITKNELN
jgi:hypothetical protein